MEQQLHNRNLSFKQLYEYEGLIDLDKKFISFLKKVNHSLYLQLLSARDNPNTVSSLQESNLIINLSPYLEEFLLCFFNIKEEVQLTYNQYELLKPLHVCKKFFIQRRAVKNHTINDLKTFDHEFTRNKLQEIFNETFCDLSFAFYTLEWLKNEESFKDNLKLSSLYAAWAVLTKEGQDFHKNSILFKLPKKVDHLKLINTEIKNINDVKVIQSCNIRHRDGFDLTDSGITVEKVLDQVNYCIWCHNQSKDYCSKGITSKDDKKNFQHNYFNEPLTGCPLEEKISEMNFIKSKGMDIAALAIIIIDNPMVAATGHRICNDCMKSCIYQKQEPVNVPQIETSILRSVLSLPWGFEIYSLLTRWNPLNIRNALYKPSSGYKVLVVGLGPAGFTLAHYLMNEGHAVAAIDGLKIEPLSSEVSGKKFDGKNTTFKLIKDVKEIYENLWERNISGFGGVAEYGITVRWDKNFLKIIRLLLERRKEFLSFGGIRFGGTLTIDQAFELGFDHIALCMGAGKPNIVSIKNFLVSGIRQASDFLMALQLTGAASKHSISNLQIRLPIVVIGGGLTAIDTATEAMAYYPVQVEKILSKYEILVKKYGQEQVQSEWTQEDKIIFEEYILHAKSIRQEREVAKLEKRKPNIIALLQQWGGVTIAYRRNIIDSPSYSRNHEELCYAMDEGIWFAENLSPIKIEVDEFNYVSQIVFDEKKDNVQSYKIINARTILVAAGTVPNTILAKEDPSNLSIEGYHFQAYDERSNPITPEPICKPKEVHILASIRGDQKSISFFGDLHPSFSGNVVKAMASAKNGYKIISNMLSRIKPQASHYSTLWDTLNQSLKPTIYKVERLAPNIIEIIVHAPMAAKAFQPGQFYRLQNFKSDALVINDTFLMMEGIAVTGAWVDRDKGLVSVIILEVGASSNICKILKVGQPVILMGPTGTPTHIPSNETVLLIGGGLGNAVLFSIGQSLRKAGSRVLYFAGYKKIQDRFKVEELEKAADQIIWCCEESPSFITSRKNDVSFVGNIIEAMSDYSLGKIQPNVYPFNTIDRIIAIGSDKMMYAVEKARKTIFRNLLKPSHIALGSINAPMQCMMKEICGQCLQIYYDPITKDEKVVFVCSYQDLELQNVDFLCLSNRLKQNSLQEKITALWVNYCLSSLPKDQIV